MIISLFVVSILLVISIAFNIILFIHVKKPKKESTYDVKHLLRDLLAGQGLVRVTRVAPEDFFIRSAGDM